MKVENFLINRLSAFQEGPCTVELM